MIRRVLVTGATGFIGRQALDRLAARGCEVHAVARRRPSEPVPSVAFHSVDLHDADGVGRLLAQVRPDALLHLAWDVTHGQYVTSLENFRWVQATLNLTRSFFENGGHRAVCAGTSAEYDWRFGYCSEALTPLRPASPYAACKHGVSQILAQLAHQMGASFAWGRVFFLYGPHEAPGRLVPSIIDAALAGAPARLRNPDQIRDYMHVRDVAGAFVALLFSSVDGFVNIASGDPVRLRDIGGAVFRELGVPERFEAVAPDGQPDPYPLVAADVRRLRSEVGFQPQFSLETGVKDMLTTWQQRETARA